MPKHLDLMCPRCGEATARLHEGYCAVCLDEQNDANWRYEFERVRWNNLTLKEREQEIKAALRR
jgi:ribosomal protein L37E